MSLPTSMGTNAGQTLAQAQRLSQPADCHSRHWRHCNWRTCPRVHAAERAGEEGLAVLRHEAAVQSVGRHVILVAVEADLAPMQRWGGCQGRRSWAANNRGELAVRRRQLQ